MASIEEAAAGLAAALRSGNAQDSDSALALYDEALDGGDEADVSLGPIKRPMSIDEALESAESGGATDQDLEDLVANASDATKPSTTHDAGPEETMDERAEDIGDHDKDDKDEA